MKLIKYEDYLYNHLKKLLKEFQDEVYHSTTTVDVDSFIDCHWAIYMVLDNSDEVVGFSSFIYNTYYGLRETTIGNDYLFISKGSRRSRAMHLISIQAGAVCVELGVPLEHYIADGSGSEKFVGRLSGKKLYCTYVYALEEVEREFSRLKTKVKVK